MTLHVCFEPRITKNKAFYFEFFKEKLKHTCNYFRINIEWSCKRDHAGPNFEVELLGFYFRIGIYDGRHWNHEKGRWNLDNEYCE